jgi:transposase
VIGSTRQVTVYAYRTPTDMRKSFDTLTALVVQGLERDVLSGDLFLFVSKTRRRAKVLFWDGTGLCLFAKRLEKGHFAAPWSHAGTGPLSLTVTELELLLEGSALVWKVPLSPSPWTPGDRVLRWG